MVKKWYQAASLTGLFLCATLAFLFWRAGVFTSREALTDYLAQFGWGAPLVFVAFQAVQVVLPILPGGLGLSCRCDFLWRVAGILVQLHRNLLGFAGSL